MFLIMNDLYIGINSGYIWSNTNLDQTSITFGSEIGYKYKSNNPMFLNSKYLLSYPLKSSELLPGFESLLGCVNESMN